ncbi:DUF6401 family natural product biosynthesis protein [Amycolatopsis acidiphila]|uniref:Uncharacterized protein n=1 Tax=Amycolatopsis acidiphila TaxID=715473 RepID=A0A558AHF6_9PSEU|nr:DUF6401 family natural product biosynthesis protein [Amycolatopsis acidiphila]TVT23687.1 hypothetical protein FNH06_09310 [Amycolatopsis acidiphila]UIJ58679.1 DUF6401 family natural product biosynthesis protein [Amycolatopsis acidiphila]GHG76066.1 hypothetical protein GCM10017788_41260 [Amycolatopsis acidiphila]
MGWADYLADRSARRWFYGLAGRLDPGWSALAVDPGLWRAYDRHASAVADAVRCEDDLVARQEPVSDLVLIASHAHDVWTGADARGWTPPADVSRWTPEEWTGLRLLACLRLAAAEPRGPRLSPAAAELRRESVAARKRVR